MAKKHSQLVLVEFDNCSPYVEKFTSNQPITLKRVVEHMEKTHDDINWNKDGVTFVDDPTETSIVGRKSTKLAFVVCAIVDLGFVPEATTELSP